METRFSVVNFLGVVSLLACDPQSADLSRCAGGGNSGAAYSMDMDMRDRLCVVIRMGFVL